MSEDMWELWPHQVKFLTSDGPRVLVTGRKFVSIIRPATTEEELEFRWTRLMEAGEEDS